MALVPELIADCQCQLGEGPLWNPFDRCIYWTDILEGYLFRLNTDSLSWEVCYQGASIGGFTLQPDGSLLLFQDKGAITLWKNGVSTSVRDEHPEEIESRFNDVQADPHGRVFCGTMPTPHRLGRLYRLDRDGSLTVVLENIGISNGIAFNIDEKHVFYTDSKERSIYQLDYEASTGHLSNQRLWLRTPEGRGEPDGLTIDREGNLWSARWDDGALYQYSPSGVELQRIEFPARKVTCAVFGGEDLSDLYVTTALNGGTREQEGPGAGALFRLKPRVPGAVAYLSRITC